MAVQNIEQPFFIYTIKGYILSLNQNITHFAQ